MVDYTLLIEQFIKAFNSFYPISPLCRIAIGDLHILIMVENCQYYDANKLKSIQKDYVNTQHVMKELFITHSAIP